MFAIPALLKFVAWPLTLGGAALVFGWSANGALSLVADHVLSSSAVLRQSVATPPVVARMVPPTKMLAVPTALATRPLHPHSAASAAPESTPPVASLPTMEVVANGLVVRAQAQKASQSVGVLRSHDLVDVVRQQRGWLLIRKGTLTGWVYGKYLRPVDGGAPSEPAA